MISIHFHFEKMNHVKRLFTNFTPAWVVLNVPLYYLQQYLSSATGRWVVLRAAQGSTNATSQTLPFCWLVMQ